MADIILQQHQMAETNNQNVDSLYTKLWKSLIQPERLNYYVDDLRPEYYDSPNGETFKRFDFSTKTVLGDTLAVSLFLP